MMVPSESLPDPVKLTARGAVPLVGLALADAVGGTLGAAVGVALALVAPE